MANGKKKILDHPLLKNRKQLKNNKFWSFTKTASLYALIGFSALILISFFAEGNKKTEDVPLSQVVADIKEQKIEKLTLENDQILTKYKDSDKVVTTRKEVGESIYQVLKNSVLSFVKRKTQVRVFFPLGQVELRYFQKMHLKSNLPMWLELMKLKKS